MSFTNFSNGVASFGFPVVPGYKAGVTVDNNSSVARAQKHYWVHGNVGNDGNSGTSPDKPLRTMQAAFNKLGSGDVIHFNGSTTEQLSTPAGIFDVTIIGEGNQPRHADAHTSNNGYSTASWKAGSSASTPNLIIQHQGWKIYNVLFDPAASAAAIQLLRTDDTGDSEEDASHAHIVGCKFVAGQNHIEFKGGLSQCVIEGNLFFGATGDSIAETVGDGVGTNNYHRIINNEFHNNDTHIDLDMNYATVKWNTFGKWTTKGILTGGGSNNMVWGNYLSGDYDAGYVAGTSDEWAGNYSMDVSSDEVGDNAITTAVSVA